MGDIDPNLWASLAKQYTGGINAPVAGQAGYVATVNSDEDNLEYVEGSTLVTLAGSSDYDIARWDTGSSAWVAQGVSAVLAAAIPGTVTGQLLQWSGSAWATTTNVTYFSGGIELYQIHVGQSATLGNGISLAYDRGIYWLNSTGATKSVFVPSGTNTLNVGIGLDLQGNELQNFRNARGNATTLPGSGSGDVALKLATTVTTLTLSDLVDDDEANCWGVRIRVEDDDGANACEDKFEFALRRASGDIQVSDGLGNRDSGATAQIIVYGPDSGYQYTLDVSDTGNTIALSLEDDAAQARVARVTSWWDVAEDVS